jgi:hypothetical protein
MVQGLCHLDALAQVGRLKGGALEARELIINRPASRDPVDQIVLELAQAQGKRVFGDAARIQCFGLRVGQFPEKVANEMLVGFGAHLYPDETNRP